MIARYRQFLSDLGDPAKFVREPDVAVFDEHVEKGKGGKVVRKFDRAALEEIARNCNARDAGGTPCPITIGHTDPEEADERKQPEIVGYARNFRVRFDGRLSRWTLRSDYYLFKGKYAYARTFTRTSVELWESDHLLDPIALLRRTPQRDLG